MITMEILIYRKFYLAYICDIISNFDYCNHDKPSSFPGCCKENTVHVHLNVVVLTQKYIKLFNEVVCWN